MLYRLQASSIARRIVSLPRRAKSIVMLVADSVAIPICLAASLLLVAPSSSLWALVWPWVACAATALYLFHSFGLYRSIVRFIGVGLAVIVVKGVTILAIGVAVTVAVVDSTGLALKISVAFWLVAAAYLCGSRLAVKLFLKAACLTGDRVIIYGAGNAGTQLASAISRGGRFAPVAFVDDSPSVYGTVINDLEIYPPDTLPRLIKSLGVARVLLALPSISRRQRRRIISQLAEFPVHVQSIPDIDDLISGNVRSDELVEVDVADLLGRVACLMRVSVTNLSWLPVPGAQLARNSVFG
jgi:FlaA1/EpsC-like NDP-sugar epimerase